MNEGVYRWINEASRLLNEVSANGRSVSWLEQVDRLLSGVPAPNVDLGFNSPADQAARSETVAPGAAETFYKNRCLALEAELLDTLTDEQLKGELARRGEIDAAIAASPSAIAAPALELGDRVIVALDSGHLEEGKVVDIGIWVKHDGDNSAHEYSPRQVSKVNP